MTDRAIKLSGQVTASEIYGQILLFTPSDQPDNTYVPPQEIYLSKDEITRLYEWAVLEATE